MSAYELDLKASKTLPIFPRPSWGLDYRATNGTDLGSIKSNNNSRFRSNRSLFKYIVVLVVLPIAVVMLMLRNSANVPSSKLYSMRHSLAVSYQHATVNVGMKNYSEIKYPSRLPCNVSTALPVWSWGIRRACCDVFPNLKIAESEGPPSDVSHLSQGKIQQRSIVYVYASDFLYFLTLFRKFPSHYRITLVTGNGDFSAPFHLMGEPYPFFLYYDNPATDSERSEKVREFLSDKRLHRWYAQNFDLEGCNPITNLCSDLSKQEVEIFVKKVRPIPIGLDFHTFAGKGDMENVLFKERVCHQREVIEKKLKLGAPFANKNLTVISAFKCDFGLNDMYRQRTRREICDLVSRSTTKGLLVPYESKQGEDARETFWSHLQYSLFALAPFGYGLDTHRVWEILAMHSIPVVRSSSLDSLYSQFPVAIVDSWEDALNPQKLKEQLASIQNRFGSDPFNQDVMRRLSLDYWVDVIRNGSLES